MTTLKIKKGQYLKDILSEIPTNSIIYKTLTGIGATTLEIDTPRNSIIMEPNVPVIKGKKQKGLLGIYEGVTIDTIIDYFNSDIKHKKLMVTPESFFKIKEAAEFLDIKLYEDYMFLFDESDRVIQDVGFRKKITFPMDDFFKFKNKAFISATALNPSDPRFSTNGFEKLIIQPNFDYSIPIDLITTNNVYLSLKAVFERFPSENYCIFFNSTNMIGSYIKKMEINPESHVYCSRESSYQLKVSGITHVFDHLKDFQKYNFFTSRFNSAVDIYMDVKPTVIIITDLNAAMHSMVHPKTESIQIVGRFRKGVDKVIHITNLDADLKPMAEDEVRGWLNGCEKTYSDISALHMAATNPGSKATLAECLQLITYANFINSDGSKNYFMEDNMFLEEEIKRSYMNEDSFVKSYQLAHFEPYHLPDSFPLSDEIDSKLNNGISMIKVVNAVLDTLAEITNNSSLYSFNSKQTVLNDLQKSFPEIVEAYNVLGPDELKKNGYSKKQIRKAIKLHKQKLQKSNYGLLASLQTYFEDGIDYPTTELKRLTSLAIQQNNLDLPSHIKLVHDFFELGPRKTLGFDKDGSEIKGYRVNRCKFNRPE